MPRQGKLAPPPPAGGEAEEELMVVVLKLKGSGDTLKRGFETLNNAFQAMIVPPAAPTSRKAIGQNGNGAKQIAGGATAAESQTEDEPEVLDAEYVDQGDEPEATPAKQSAARPRSTYKFMSDFKLDVSDEHWQDFAARKNPKTENEKYLTAAEWITKNAGLETFGANHVFSCFRAMKWGEMRISPSPCAR